MRAVIVTAGKGLHEPFATRLCERLRTLNPGVVVHNASREVDWVRLRAPNWGKVFIDPPPYAWDWMIWMDPDVFPLRALPLDEIPDDAQFAAVLDRPLTRDFEMAGFPPVRVCGNYFNAGVFALRRDAVDVLDDLRRAMDAKEQGTCEEQSWLNVIVQQRDLRTHVLERKWNWLAVTDPPPVSLVNVHAAGMPTGPRFRMLRALYAVGGERCVS